MRADEAGASGSTFGGVLGLGFRDLMLTRESAPLGPVQATGCFGDHRERALGPKPINRKR